MSYSPWENDGLPDLNIAATCPATEAHGPGLRAAVWVQGCAFQCPDCISPEWIPKRIETLMTPEKLAQQLLRRSDITGVTFSGGEPMLQAAGLARLMRLMRQQRELSLICFSGFQLEQLRHHPYGTGVAELLSEIDVLIDGQYIADKNDNQGLRGSSNQRIHFLTDRISPEEYAFESGKRKVEIYIQDGETLLVGVPPQGVLESFDTVIDKLQGGKL